MSIQPSELKWYRSGSVSDSTSNGGRLSNVEAATGIKNNVFPDVPGSERVAGSTKYRKMFLKVASAENLKLFGARVFLDTATPGGDSVCFFPGTQRDTQANITGSERLYGGGKLNANVAAGATSFQIATEGAALNCIRSGDLIRISNKATLDALTGNEEFVIATNVTWAGDVATVTVAAPGLLTAYDAANTRCCSVYSPGDIAAAVSSVVANSASGIVDGAQIGTDAIGTVEQSWTLTFTSATAFNITGDTLGSVGSGNVGSTTSPNNGQFSKPYFTLPPAVFSGTFASGDTVTFTTSPAAVPIWFRRNVPANTPSLSGNRFVVGCDGESA